MNNNLFSWIGSNKNKPHLLNIIMIIVILAFIDTYYVSVLSGLHLT